MIINYCKLSDCMSFSGTRTWEGTLKTLATKPLFEQETWLVGWCLFFFLKGLKIVKFRLQQRTLSVLFVNHVNVVSVLSALRGEVGYSMLACKSWPWWLRGYWKRRSLNWKAWWEELLFCISSHFTSQPCLKMPPFCKHIITCELLIAQAARGCHHTVLLVTITAL